jgi:hypothetical protein
VKPPAEFFTISASRPGIGFIWEVTALEGFLVVAEAYLDAWLVIDFLLFFMSVQFRTNGSQCKDVNAQKAVLTFSDTKYF